MSVLLLFDPNSNHMGNDFILKTSMQYAEDFDHDCKIMNIVLECVEQLLKCLVVTDYACVFAFEYINNK